MFAKLAVVILTIGAVAGTLLASRHQRLRAVNESAEAMRRVAEHDRTLWRLRGEIAERVTPGRVRRLADSLGPLAYCYGEHFAIPLSAGRLEPARIRPAATMPAETPEEPGEGVEEERARQVEGQEDQQ